MAEADPDGAGAGSRAAIWAAPVGIAIAAVGSVLATHFDMPLGDAISSILIGLVLACTSTLLARGRKSLLIGETADGAPWIEEMIADIERRIHDAHSDVTSLFIKPQNPQQYMRTVRERFGENAADAAREPQAVAVTSGSH